MLRFLILGVLGTAIGGQLNRAIYRWAWNASLISPWSKAPDTAERRTWSDCIPILGWWRMRRESNLHGKGFWIRPMLIELACGLGLAALYWWEVEIGGFYLEQFLAHAILFALMIIATFIDIDEKTIPDYITIPGTLIALLFAVVRPQFALPNSPNADPLLLTSPQDWASFLDTSQGLVIAIVCWLGWCYALLPRTIYFKRGIGKAIQFLLASIVRHPFSIRIALMGVIGLPVVVWTWAQGAPEQWQALMSSLVGMAFAGGLVWAIRVVSSYVLGMEAMGFGDVTLMGMIGAFLGWQAAMMTFFLAPFTSLLIALVYWVVTGRRDIPFGPFLCFAAGIVIIGWETIWVRYAPIFGLGLFIPLVICVGIALMGVMLALLQLVKRFLGFA